MNKIVFGIIGAGWRSEFYLRIAKELSERFEVCGIVIRDKTKQGLFHDRWNANVYDSIDSMLNEHRPLFMVVSVSRESAPTVIGELAAKGVPVLAETPPAPDVDTHIELNRLTARGAKIQVAEQYHLQPLHAARISIANSGLLGKVTQAQVSVCHGYHGMSLIRKFLGINFENAIIKAISFDSHIIKGPGRHGGPDIEEISQAKQVIATLDFGGKLGVYDFTGEQYFSWIRSQRLLVRGERGEINDEQVSYLKNFDTPIHYRLLRQNAGENGNLEGYYLKGIIAGEQWAYRNPFIPGKLTDDEISIASCLEKMSGYIMDGISFYSLSEASQDHYLSLMIEKALQHDEIVKTETQPWASEIL